MGLGIDEQQARLQTCCQPGDVTWLFVVGNFSAPDGPAIRGDRHDIRTHLQASPQATPSFARRRKGFTSFFFFFIYIFSNLTASKTSTRPSTCYTYTSTTHHLTFSNPHTQIHQHLQNVVSLQIKHHPCPLGCRHHISSPLFLRRHRVPENPGRDRQRRRQGRRPHCF